MNRNALTLLAALALLLASPLAAADAADAAAESAPPTKPSQHRCEYELEECLNWMAKYYVERGWAGMMLDVQGYTYTVTAVQEGTPAAKGGIKPGDLLVAVNGVEFAEENRDKLAQLREKMKPGAQFTYTIKREGRRRNVECVLVEMPLDVAAELIGRHLLIGHLDPDLAFPED